MAFIGVLCPEEKARRELALAIEEMGHRVAQAAALDQALEILAAHPKPQLLVVADDAKEKLAESLLAEAERTSPLLPVVAALSARDAARAVDLIRAGAVEVVAPPWTRESLSACVSKALRFRGTSFEVVRPVETARNAIFYCIAAAAFLGVAFGYATLARKQHLAEAAKKPAPLMDWDLPYSHPSGLAYHGGMLWIADWYAQAVYRHDPTTLALRRTSALPTEMPEAIATTGDALYVASQSGQITKHMLDGELKLLIRYPNKFPGTVGMAYDGLYLWTLDGRDKLLRKHLLDAELTVLNSYPYAGSKPAAIACDGKHLWSIDAGDHELVEHDLNDPRRVIYRLPLPAYQYGEWRPTGLAWDGARIWSVAESAVGPDKPGHIFQHPVSARALPGS